MGAQVGAGAHRAGEPLDRRQLAGRAQPAQPFSFRSGQGAHTSPSRSIAVAIACSVACVQLICR